MYVIHPLDIKKITYENGVIVEIKLKRKYKDRGFGGKALNIKSLSCINSESKKNE